MYEREVLGVNGIVKAAIGAVGADLGEQRVPCGSHVEVHVEGNEGV